MGKFIGEKKTEYCKQRKFKDGDILEKAYIMPNNKGIIIEKIKINEKENIVTGYDILDNNGNIIGQIKDDVEIYISPDGEYFIGLERNGYDFCGDIKFYNRNGVLYANRRVFDFVGAPQISFSLDSRYIAISVYGTHVPKKNGVVMLDNNGNILWKKTDSNWTFEKMTFSKSNNLFALSLRKWSLDFKSHECKLVVFSTKDGEKKWEYNTSLIISAISFTPDESKIVIFGYYVTSKKRKGVVQVLNAENGIMFAKFTLPTDFKWLTESYPTKILQTSDKFILIRIGYESDPNPVEDIFVMDYNGQLIGKKRISYASFELKPDIKLDDDEIIIIENTKITLYEVKQQ